MKFSLLYGTRSFVYCIYSSSPLVPFHTCHHNSSRSILILSFQARPAPPTRFFPSQFPTKLFIHPSFPRYVLCALLISHSRPGRFTPGEGAPGTHWIGGWVGPRAGLDDMEKWKFLTLPGLELRPLSRRARSQSLYGLRYPGSHVQGQLYILIYPLLRNCKSSIQKITLHFLTEQAFV
jgi:hypothetical protein